MRNPPGAIQTIAELQALVEAAQRGAESKDWFSYVDSRSEVGGILTFILNQDSSLRFEAEKYGRSPEYWLRGCYAEDRTRQGSLFISSEENPLRLVPYGQTNYESFVFTNFWHAYAEKLRRAK